MKILFLCPHNAAKSVMAMEYFNKRAQQESISAHAFSAGTHPDEIVAPPVAEFLQTKGYYKQAHTPVKVSSTDTNKADIVVSMGCEISEFPKNNKELLQWDEVPSPSQGLEDAWNQTKLRIDELITRLS